MNVDIPAAVAQIERDELTFQSYLAVSHTVEAPENMISRIWVTLEGVQAFMGEMQNILDTILKYVNQNAQRKSRESSSSPSTYTHLPRRSPSATRRSSQNKKVDPQGREPSTPPRRPSSPSNKKEKTPYKPAVKLPRSSRSPNKGNSPPPKFGHRYGSLPAWDQVVVGKGHQRSPVTFGVGPMYG